MKPRRKTTTGRARNTASARKPGGKLTLGASAAATSRLLAAAKKHSAAVTAQELKTAKAEKANLRARLAQPRAALARFVRKESGFSRFQTEWDALVEPGGRPEPAVRQSDEDRAARVALMHRHRSLFETAYVAAGIDANAVSKAVGSLLKPGIERMLPLDLGNILAIPSIAGPAPAPTEFELTLPYGSSDAQSSENVFGFEYASTTPSNGTFSLLTRAAVDADAYGAAVLGDVVTIPAGFTRLRITASVHVTLYELMALGLADVSGAGCRIVLELTDSNGTVKRESDLIARVLAPLLWYAAKTGEGDFQITRTLPVPVDGGEVLVRAGAQALAWAAGLLGGCKADVSGWVRRISIEALP